jgi:hypothetical protein
MRARNASERPTKCGSKSAWRGKIKVIRRIFLYLIGGLLPSLIIADDAAYLGSSAWQERRLLEPTPAELAREAGGQIFIYDGMTESVVDQALGEEFERVQSMMFIRTKREEVEPDGDVVTYVDDDDC